MAVVEWPPFTSYKHPCRKSVMPCAMPLSGSEEHYVCSVAMRSLRGNRGVVFFRWDMVFDSRMSRGEQLWLDSFHEPDPPRVSQPSPASSVNSGLQRLPFHQINQNLVIFFTKSISKCCKTTFKEHQPDKAWSLINEKRRLTENLDWLSFVTSELNLSKLWHQTNLNVHRNKSFQIADLISHLGESISQALSLNIKISIISFESCSFCCLIIFNFNLV